MRLKMRGRAFLVGHWVHETEILGEMVPWVPRVSELVPAQTDLLRRLGLADATRFDRGDLLVAGRGFGHGTRRDHAPLLLKMHGVAAVLAESLDPRFRDSALRVGLPVLALPHLGALVQAEDELIVDMENGTIENLRTRRVAVANPPSPRELQLLADAPGLELLGILTTDAPDPDVLEVPARVARADGVD